jgi:cytidine deaminase, homotetrameric
MKKLTVKTTIQVYHDVAELDHEDQKLLMMAHKATKDAWAPYSNFAVGAAVRLANGKYFPGSNQENAAYPTGLCAERTALSVAASRHPKSAVLALAVTVKTNTPINRPVSPCGSCRQAIFEVEQRYGENIKIIMQGETGDIYVCNSIKDLFPLSFTADLLP